MNEAIVDSVERLYKAQKDMKTYERVYNNIRKKEQLEISNYMFSNLPNGVETFKADIGGNDSILNRVSLQVTRVRRKKITWLVDKLKKKLNKEVYKSIVDKKYTVNDMQGLTKYLKECGVDPKKFKKYIDVEEQVNESAIELCYETGALKRSDLKDCYNVEVGEPYIRLTEIKE